MHREYSWDLKRAIEKHGFRPIQLWKNSKYEKGKTYWSGYWCKYYRVLDVTYEQGRLKSVTVEWQDGHKGTHCTWLRWESDWELRWSEGKEFEIDVPEPKPAVDDFLFGYDDFDEFDLVEDVV